MSSTALSIKEEFVKCNTRLLNMMTLYLLVANDGELYSHWWKVVESHFSLHI